MGTLYLRPLPISSRSISDIFPNNLRMTSISNNPEGPMTIFQRKKSNTQPGLSPRCDGNAIVPSPQNHPFQGVCPVSDNLGVKNEERRCGQKSWNVLSNKHQ